MTLKLLTVCASKNIKHVHYVPQKHDLVYWKPIIQFTINSILASTGQLYMKIQVWS
jgi:hypothetical protein